MLTRRAGMVETSSVKIERAAEVELAEAGDAGRVTQGVGLRENGGNMTERRGVDKLKSRARAQGGRSTGCRVEIEGPTTRTNGTIAATGFRLFNRPAEPVDM